MATSDKKNDTSELNSQAVALAEQLGRIAGTLEGTAEAWLNRASLADQLGKVRDVATQLLNNLSGGSEREQETTPSAPPQPKAAAPARKRAPKRKTRSASARTDPAHAPGKRHRRPAPSARGVKKSDQTIPKMRTAEAVRRRRKYS